MDSPKIPFWTTVSRTMPSPLLRRALNNCRGDDPPKKNHPSKLKHSLRRQFRDNLYKLCPPFPFKNNEKTSKKSLPKLFVQTVFYLGGCFLGGLSSFEQYLLPRNQYINNSPKVFSCIRAGANTGAACIRT